MWERILTIIQRPSIWPAPDARSAPNPSGAPSSCRRCSWGEICVRAAAAAGCVSACVVLAPAAFSPLAVGSHRPVAAAGRRRKVPTLYFFAFRLRSRSPSRRLFLFVLLAGSLSFSQRQDRSAAERRRIPLHSSHTNAVVQPQLHSHRGLLLVAPVVVVHSTLHALTSRRPSKQTKIMNEPHSRQASFGAAAGRLGSG